MDADQTVPKKGRTRFAPDPVVPELAELKATCRRQTLVIDKLSDAISALRSDVTMLEVESADLRDENARIREHMPDPLGTGERAEMVEACLPLDVQAPGAARLIVADFLRDRVAPRLFDTAQLIISELVSNSLRHNAVPSEQTVVIRVSLERSAWRLEVEDPGGGGVLAPDPERAVAGRLGMNLVQSLSNCWGVEHAAERGTRAWAFLPRPASSTYDHRNGARPGVVDDDAA
jgi:anti-sigma regulatory factor (Ser/Thr protein kinase)